MYFSAVPGRFKWEIGNRDPYSGFLPVTIDYMGLRKRPVRPEEKMFLIVLIFEMDRRWGRIHKDTWKKYAANEKCPFKTGRLKDKVPPPFYEEGANYWPLPHFVRAWEAWDEENAGMRTEKVCRLFGEALREQESEIDPADVRRLIEGIRGGVSR